MNARIAIFKRDFCFQSRSNRLLYTYLLMVFTPLLGINILHRFLPSPNGPASYSVTLAEQQYVEFAEEICRKLAPDIEQFQVGMVTRSEPVKPNQGYVSIQLSDTNDRRHFHVITERQTGEVSVLSQVNRMGGPDYVESSSRNKALPRRDVQGDRQTALEIAKQSLNILFEAGAISYRKPLGVTAEHPSNWIVQWHYPDCCIIMDIRVREKQMAAFRLRRHPTSVAANGAFPSIKRCPYCLDLSKGPDLTLKPSFYAPPYLRRQ